MRGLLPAFALLAATPAAQGATVRVEETGQVEVLIGVSQSGQGHETVFAQICAEYLGVPYESVHVRGGDSNLLPYGFGTGGSRVTVNTGNAVALAAGTAAEPGLGHGFREIGNLELPSVAARRQAGDALEQQQQNRLRRAIAQPHLRREHVAGRLANLFARLVEEHFVFYVQRVWVAEYRVRDPVVDPD